MESSDVHVSADASEPTQFVFKSPIFLQTGQEYAMILKPAGNNTDYIVWVAELGGTNVGTTQIISQQPSSGVVLTSSNDRTWNDHQNLDLKYKLHRCEFDTGVTGNLVLNNEDAQYFYLDNVASGPFQVDEILTQANTGATGKLKYYNPVSDNIRVTLTDVTGTFNDTDIVTGGTSGATADVTELKDIPVNTLYPQIGQMSFNETGLTWGMKGTSVTNVIDSVYSAVQENENNDLLTERRVLGNINEDANLSGNKSLDVAGTFTSSNAKLSPVVDMQRTGMILVGNEINNDDTDESTLSGNALAKYMCRKVVLDDGQDSEDLRVWLTGYKPSGASIDVYYKIHNASDPEDFDDKSWVKMTLDTSATIVSDGNNKQDFREFEYSIPTTNLTGSGGEVQYTGGSSETYTGYKTFAIKIVLLSGSTSVVPRVKDLRAIALQV